MNCSKVKTLLPLMVGDDLPEKKKRAVNHHLETCPTCNLEYGTFLQSHQATGNYLEGTGLQWSDNDWLEAVQNAVHTVRNEAIQKTAPKMTPSKSIYHGRGWTYGIIASAAVILLLVLLPPHLKKETGGTLPADPAVAPVSPPDNGEEKGRETVSVPVPSQPAGDSVSGNSSSPAPKDLSGAVQLPTPPTPRPKKQQVIKRVVKKRIVSAASAPPAKGIPQARQPVTIVSPKSGLKIKWVFVKNIDLEDLK